MKLNACVALIVAIVVSSSIPPISALAQSPPLDRLQFQVPVGPSPGGWYSPLSNFGGIVFDVNLDQSRPIVAGEWAFQANGVPKTIYFQSEMVYSTNQQIRDTGILATFDSPTFTFTGRNDYSNPVYGGGGQVVLTGRNIRVEFTSSRVGTFIDNPGQADERRFPVVASFRGAPLFVPVDFAGDWMLVGRRETAVSHYQTQVQLHLEPYVPTNGFRIQDVSAALGNQPFGVKVPLAGARLYSTSCSSAITNGCYEAQEWVVPHCGDLCVPGNGFNLFWVNPDETGSYAYATKESNGTVVIYDYGTPPNAVFADGRTMVVRRTEGAVLVETQMWRLPTGLYEPGQP